MSESRTKTKKNQFDSPYARVGILFVGIIVVLSAVFLINLVARGLGGNEKKLMEAVIATLQEPRINGTLSLAQQAQTNTFDTKVTFSVDKLKRLSADGEVNGLYQNEKLNVPLKAFVDFDQNKTYVRISNGQKVAETIGASAPTLKSDLASIASKINDKWLLIEQGENKMNSCTAELFEKIAHDEQIAKDVAGIFAGNRFLAVESMKEKSPTAQEYTVKFDEQAMSGFVRSLKSKDYFKSVKSCDTNYDPLGTEASAAAAKQQSQATQQAAEPALTTKIIVENNRVKNLSIVSSLNQQVNTTQVALDFKPGAALTAPTQDIVNSTELKTEMASLGQIFQQQQSQQGSQAIQGAQ